MRKADLVDVVAERHRLPKVQTQLIVETILEAVTDALAAGERVDLRGFGAFSMKTTRPKVGRNIHTGEAVPIPARRVPDWKPGKELLARCGRPDSARD